MVPQIGSKKDQSITSSGVSAQSSTSNFSMSVVMKYGVISALQLIAAAVYEISFVIRIFAGWYHTKNAAGNSYLDICSIIQMMDCLILMICIYLGFARKQTVCLCIIRIKYSCNLLHCDLFATSVPSVLGDL